MLRIEIHVKGRIESHWSSWFHGLDLTHTERDETVLSGLVADQSALYGLIARLRDLGLALVSIRCDEAS